MDDSPTNPAFLMDDSGSYPAVTPPSAVDATWREALRGLVGLRGVEAVCVFDARGFLVFCSVGLAANLLSALRRLNQTYATGPLAADWCVAQFLSGFLIKRRLLDSFVWVISQDNAGLNTVRVSLDVAALKLAASNQSAAPKKSSLSTQITNDLEALFESYVGASGKSIYRRVVSRHLPIEEKWQEFIVALSRFIRPEEAKTVFLHRVELLRLQSSNERSTQELIAARQFTTQAAQALNLCAQILEASDSNVERLGEALSEASSSMSSIQAEGVEQLRSSVLRLANNSLLAYSEAQACAQTQKLLLPEGDFGIGPGFEIASAYRPAQSSGGDWWSYQSDGRNLAVVITDATGHGAAAAMVTGIAKLAFEISMQSLGFAQGPAPVFQQMSKLLHKSTQGQRVMTGLLVFLDLERGKLQVANAGHVFLHLLRVSPQEVKPVVVMGPLLGQAAASFEVSSQELKPKERFVLYTDGLTEASNEQGEQFGEKRFRRLLLLHQHKSTKEMLYAMLEAFDTFRGAMSLNDDITLIIGEYVPLRK